MTTETWRPIPGFPDYEVSDLGRVKSLKRTNPIILSPCNDNGRKRVQLRIDGRTEMKSVSHLVALAFIGPRPNGMVVCHNNSDVTNDAASNLRYDTQTGNMKDACEHDSFSGKITRLKNSDIKEIREMFSDHRQIPLWTKKHGVSADTIYRALIGETFKYAGGPIHTNVHCPYRHKDRQQPDNEMGWTDPQNEKAAR